MKKYKPCPFCGCTKIRATEIMEEPVVICSGCEAFAYPELWNSRPFELGKQLIKDRNSHIVRYRRPAMSETEKQLLQKEVQKQITFGLAACKTKHWEETYRASIRY